MASNVRGRSGGRVVSGSMSALVAGVSFLTCACSDAAPMPAAPKASEPVNICDEAMGKAEKALQATGELVPEHFVEWQRSTDRWRALIANAIQTCGDQSAIESALSKHPGAVRADLNTIIATVCTAKDLPDSVTRSTICRTNPEALKLRATLDKAQTK